MIIMIGLIYKVLEFWPNLELNKLLSSPSRSQSHDTLLFLIIDLFSYVKSQCYSPNGFEKYEQD